MPFDARTELRGPSLDKLCFDAAHVVGIVDERPRAMLNHAGTQHTAAHSIEAAVIVARNAAACRDSRRDQHETEAHAMPHQRLRMPTLCQRRSFEDSSST
jgi:hypothetical protein